MRKEDSPAGQVAQKQFILGRLKFRFLGAQLLELDKALHRLAQLDPRQAKIVELRFFAGLSVEETAWLLNISDKTVKREWSVAKAWLHAELTKPDGYVATN
jgi:RNA polymerase sigma factor (TIGR02999 family)